MPMCGAGFRAIPADQLLHGGRGLNACGQGAIIAVNLRRAAARRYNRKGQPLATTTSALETPASDARPGTVQVATTQKIELARVTTRREHDLLGDRDVPSDAYWGVHTMRAV